MTVATVTGVIEAIVEIEEIGVAIAAGAAAAAIAAAIAVEEVVVAAAATGIKQIEHRSGRRKPPRCRL